MFLISISCLSCQEHAGEALRNKQRSILCAFLEKPKHRHVSLRLHGIPRRESRLDAGSIINLSSFMAGHLQSFCWHFLGCMRAQHCLRLHTSTRWLGHSVSSISREHLPDLSSWRLDTWSSGLHYHPAQLLIAGAGLLFLAETSLRQAPPPGPARTETVYQNFWALGRREQGLSLSLLSCTQRPTASLAGAGGSWGDFRQDSSETGWGFSGGVYALHVMHLWDLGSAPCRSFSPHRKWRSSLLMEG